MINLIWTNWLAHVIHVSELLQVEDEREGEGRLVHDSQDTVERHVKAADANEEHLG